MSSYGLQAILRFLYTADERTLLTPASTFNPFRDLDDERGQVDGEEDAWRRGLHQNVNDADSDADNNTSQIIWLMQLLR